MTYLRGFCAQALPPGSISAEAFNAHDNKVTIHITVTPEIDPLEELRKSVEAFDKHAGEGRFFVIEESRRLEILGIQVNDSANLDAEVYANDHRVSARWLLGQIRDLTYRRSQSTASAMLYFNHLQAWRGMADDVLKASGHVTQSNTEGDNHG